ncbi:hypothetical protein BLOT_000960 [Blomia tropicalis]|nr:hypothetical protein BLOT_000960 [Blomia tropicalis]
MKGWVFSQTIFIGILFNISYFVVSSIEIVDSNKPSNLEYDYDRTNNDFLFTNRDPLLIMDDHQTELPKTTNNGQNEMNGKDINQKIVPHSKWYLFAAKVLNNGRQWSRTMAVPMDHLKLWSSVNRQLSKKQTNLKKNNPRDILRGLAVKRDRFY